RLEEPRGDSECRSGPHRMISFVPSYAFRWIAHKMTSVGDRGRSSRRPFAASPSLGLPSVTRWTAGGRAADLIGSTSPTRPIPSRGGMSSEATSAVVQRYTRQMRVCSHGESSTMASPWVALPRRVVTDVLVVPTLQFGDPVPFLVLVEARDLTFHRNSPRSLSGRVARLLGLVLGKRPGRCHCANHLGLPVLDDRKGQADEQLVSGLMGCPSLQGACSVLRVPGSHRLPKALPVGMPQMFRDDDVQGAADRFLRQITKEFGRGAVPELNHSLSICKDDPIRGLLDDE